LNDLHSMWIARSQYEPQSAYLRENGIHVICTMQYTRDHRQLAVHAENGRSHGAIWFRRYGRSLRSTEHQATFSIASREEGIPRPNDPSYSIALPVFRRGLLRDGSQKETSSWNGVSEYELI
jgi:hypothetical protein